MGPSGSTTPDPAPRTELAIRKGRYREPDHRITERLRQEGTIKITELQRAAPGWLLAAQRAARSEVLPGGGAPCQPRLRRVRARTAALPPLSPARRSASGSVRSARLPPRPRRVSLTHSLTHALTGQNGLAAAAQRQSRKGHDGGERGRLHGPGPPGRTAFRSGGGRGRPGGARSAGSGGPTACVL